MFVIGDTFINYTIAYEVLNDYANFHTGIVVYHMPIRENLKKCYIAFITHVYC
jgi:hypothetical protein